MIEVLSSAVAVVAILAWLQARVENQWLHRSRRMWRNGVKVLNKGSYDRLVRFDQEERWPW